MSLYKLLGKKTEEDYHYLFISMPLNYEDGTNVDDEGMIGKVLNDARKNQKETTEKISENKKVMNAKFDENQSKIDAI